MLFCWVLGTAVCLKFKRPAVVASWTVDRMIWVQFSAYPHPLWALHWEGGKRHLQMSRCPCRGRLTTQKTPSFPRHWLPCSRSKFGNWTTVLSFYSWNVAECDVKPPPNNQKIQDIRAGLFQLCLNSKLHEIWNHHYNPPQSFGGYIGITMSVCPSVHILSGPLLLTCLINLDNISHNCCPGFKGVSWPWPKVTVHTFPKSVFGP